MDYFPSAYDLASDEQFTGGRDVALYTFHDPNDAAVTYAYVSAGDKGWKIIDVTDPAAPGVIFTRHSAPSYAELAYKAT